MRSWWWIPAALFITLLIHETWTIIPLLVPDHPFELIRPFPFSDQEVSRSYYIFGACGYAIFVINNAIIESLAPFGRVFFRVFLAFSILEFFEYFLTYNEAWFFIETPIFTVSFHITSIRLVTMFYLTINLYYNQWNLGK